MHLPSPLRLVPRLAPDGLPFARRLVHAGLGHVFGPPPAGRRAHGGDGDAGFFGPGSATWRVIGEPAAIVGGIRALLVQLLHPHAMAGVAEHSHFRGDALGRLRRTSAYVTATAFAPTSTAVDAARSVRRVHREVAGVAPDGSPYRADDPHLLAWVSIALTSSFLATDRCFAPWPVADEAADRFVSEQSHAAALLDPRVDLAAVRDAPDDPPLPERRLRLPMVTDGLLPRDVAELQRLVARYRSELEVNEQGRDALRFLVWPGFDAPVKAVYLSLLGGAFATIDPHMRRLLGVRLGPAAPLLASQARVVLAGLRVAAGPSPALRAARARTARAGDPTQPRVDRRSASVQ